MSKAASRRGSRSASAPRTEKPQGHAHVVADRVWLVLARRAYEEPLRQVGTVTADDADLAQVYARTIYDEFAWVEMAVVPRDALVTVIAS
jgi:hypothetical protein